MRAADRRTLTVGLTLTGLLAAGVGCAPSRTDEVSPQASMAPVITRLEPSSGWAGVAYPISVTIHGSGFMETGNVVVFGPVMIEDRPSTNGGTQITFSVPKVRPATGEVPPMVLPPGEYQVIVRSARGSSKPASFTLTRPGDPGVHR